MNLDMFKKYLNIKKNCLFENIWALKDCEQNNTMGF